MSSRGYAVLVVAQDGVSLARVEEGKCFGGDFIEQAGGDLAGDVDPFQRLGGDHRIEHLLALGCS